MNELRFAKDDELIAAMSAGKITDNDVALIRNTLDVIARNSEIPPAWLPRINEVLAKLKN